MLQLGEVHEIDLEPVPHCYVRVLWAWLAETVEILVQLTFETFFDVSDCFDYLERIDLILLWGIFIILKASTFEIVHLNDWLFDPKLK
jgi:hypothetical protein